MQKVPIGEVVCVRTRRRSNALCGPGQIVGGPLKLNVGTEKKPIRARFSERHADAAGVDHAHVADGALELHMSVTADDEIRGKIPEDRQKVRVRSQTGKDVGIVSRGGMAEEHGPYSIN